MHRQLSVLLYKYTAKIEIQAKKATCRQHDPFGMNLERLMAKSTYSHLIA